MTLNERRSQVATLDLNDSLESLSEDMKKRQSYEA